MLLKYLDYIWADKKAKLTLALPTPSMLGSQRRSLTCSLKSDCAERHTDWDKGNTRLPAHRVAPTARRKPTEHYLSALRMIEPWTSAGTVDSRALSP